MRRVSIKGGAKGLHAQAQFDQLEAAHRKQTADLLALTAALHEAHAILRSRTSGHLPGERIRLAATHISQTLARHGHFPTVVQRNDKMG